MKVLKQYPCVQIEGRTVRLHTIRAEKALGHPMPKGAEVHHVDGTKSIDSPLVICQDHAYHYLLHMRQRILRAGGNPDTDSWCSACKQPLPNMAFYIRRTQSGRKRAKVLTTVCRGCTKLRENGRVRPKRVK